jgi:hypothetical protein
LSGAEAGQYWGCSERQSRRYRRRNEKDDLDGLVDRRWARVLAKRACRR